MSVNAATEYDSALRAYLDNAGYEANGSVSEARAFLTACTRLLALTPALAGTRESTTQMKVDELRQQQSIARGWLAANDTNSTRSGGPSVTRADFRNFRD